MWTIKESAAETVLFECESCAREIRFVREGYGEPFTDGVVPPVDPIEYLGRAPECGE
jgi:hypothetical protein